MYLDCITSSSKIGCDLVRSALVVRLRSPGPLHRSAALEGVVDDVVRLARVLSRVADPAHHLAQALADDLDRVRAGLPAQAVEGGPAGVVFLDPLAREGAALDFAEDLLHLGAHRFADHP